MSKKAKILITIFLGPIGVHKFLDKDYIMGFIYLFTFGLFGVGWIIDIIKVIKSNDEIPDSLMSLNTKRIIHKNQLPTIIANNLNLSEGEVCHYADIGYTFKDKTITTGYVGNNGSANIKITKDLSYRAGISKMQAVREQERIKYKGILYITNKRIIFSSQKDNFDSPINKVTSVIETKDGLIIQIGTKSYSIITATHSEFIKVFNMIKKGENL